MKDGPLDIGDHFQGYEIVDKLGKGGFAWVYRAQRKLLNREVAIKVLHRPEGITREMLLRGQREAQILDKLDHPNIVELIDAHMTQEGQLYLIMELLRGQTMRAALAQYKRFTVEEILIIALQVAYALAAAHDFKEPVVHRDLKPENVFITDTLDDLQVVLPEERDARGYLLKPRKEVILRVNRIKVLDFGIAKIINAPGVITQREVVPGTVSYMSPEQVKALPLTPVSDIFPLGLMIFESLYCHPLLLGLGSEEMTIHRLQRLIVSYMPQPLHELDPRISPAVAKLVDRAIAKKPLQRFQSMRALADALRACLKLRLRELEAQGKEPQIRDLSRVLRTGRTETGASKSPSFGPHGTELMSAPLQAPNSTERQAWSEALAPERVPTVPEPKVPLDADALAPSGRSREEARSQSQASGSRKHVLGPAVPQTVVPTESPAETQRALRTPVETPSPTTNPSRRSRPALSSAARKSLRLGLQLGGVLGSLGIAVLAYAFFTAQDQPRAASAQEAPKETQLPSKPQAPLSTPPNLNSPRAAGMAPPQATSDASASAAAPLSLVASSEPPKPQIAAPEAKRTAQAPRPEPRTKTQPKSPAERRMLERLRRVTKDLNQGKTSAPAAPPSSSVRNDSEEILW